MTTPTSTDFKKVVQVRLPFDRRKDEKTGENYGHSGIEIWFVLIGPKGATQFTFGVDAYLESTYQAWEEMGVNHQMRDGDNGHFSGWDVGYHALAPQYEGQHQMDCEHLEGGKCYYDGLSLYAAEWAKEIFSIKNRSLEDEIWKRLELEYSERFS